MFVNSLYICVYIEIGREYIKSDQVSMNQFIKLIKGSLLFQGNCLFKNILDVLLNLLYTRFLEYKIRKFHLVFDTFKIKKTSKIIVLIIISNRF